MIIVRNLTKKFDKHTVLLNRVDLHVPAGSTCVILGRNGVGKTTLLKIIAGLVPYHSGKIQLGSKNLSMVFQKNALFDSMTVLENLTYPLIEKHKRLGMSYDLEILKNESLEMLAKVGLAGSDQKIPLELSGGMQKRLAIARAILLKPDLLLCDEPTAGLDPITAKSICELLLSFKKTKMTSVFVTSEIKTAMRLADELYLFVPEDSSFELLHVGSPQDFLNSHNKSVIQFRNAEVKGPLSNVD